MSDRDESLLATVRAVALAAAAMNLDPTTPPTQVAMRAWNRARRTALAPTGHVPLAHELLRQVNARRAQALTWHEFLTLAFGG